MVAEMLNSVLNGQKSRRECYQVLNKAEPLSKKIALAKSRSGSRTAKEAGLSSIRSYRGFQYTVATVAEIQNVQIYSFPRGALKTDLRGVFVCTPDSELSSCIGIVMIDLAKD